MDRRHFLLTLLASALAAPLAGQAEQAAKVARVGFLTADMGIAPHLREAFLQGMRDLGYVEGRNLVMEYRSGDSLLARADQIIE